MSDNPWWAPINERVVSEDGLARKLEGNREGGHATYRANFSKKQLVPALKVRPLVQELVERFGSERAVADATGLSRNMIRCVLHGKACEGGTTRDFVEKGTARKIILALYEKRKDDRRDHATHERMALAAEYRRRREEAMMRSYY